ncbi:MAG: hypothetical protein HZA12_03705 [Nitrospirae bacterium]|nr:hypothetical protein [Nitrospirota bacterium]
MEKFWNDFVKCSRMHGRLFTVDTIRRLANIRIVCLSIILSLFSIALTSYAAEPVGIGGADNNLIGQVRAGRPWVESEIIVKFKKVVPATFRVQIHGQKGVEVVDEIPEIEIQLVRSVRGEMMEEILSRYVGDPNIEYAEPNHIFQAITTPNDPSFSQLWGLRKCNEITD